MPRYGRPTQITAARAKRYGRARGSTRPSAVAAAIDEVACAEGKESFVGARASGGCSSISGRCRPTASFTTKLTPTATGPVAPASSHWPRRRSSIVAPTTPVAAQTAAYSPAMPRARIATSTGS